MASIKDPWSKTMDIDKWDNSSDLGNDWIEFSKPWQNLYPSQISIRITNTETTNVLKDRIGNTVYEYNERKLYL